MTSGAGPRGRGRPSARQDAGRTDGPVFDDALDSEVARLWLDLAGVKHGEQGPRADAPGAAASDAPDPSTVSAPASGRRRTGTPPEEQLPPAPADLGLLLTRASDLPTPVRRPRDAEDTDGSDPVPLPWTTTAGAEDRRAAGTGRARSRTPRAVPAEPVPTEPAPRVIGGGARDEPAEDEPRRRRGRRPGPASLPEEPREREEAAREVVLRQLAMGPRSRGQLERKLAERQADPELIARILDRFEEVGLVDDAAFAEVWVRSRARGRRLSRRAISRELHEKGVDRDVAEEALAAVEPEDERQAALDLVHAKMRGRPAPAADGPAGRAERDKVVRRLVGMLGRRGYGPGLAFGVVQEVLGELDG
ncbi:regulatory protein RecX [Micrococcus lacusdianchii]|uniref:regulatory protein RecX n=1 Tax=Micrococcus lacusdianchii TaxID=2915940 RepID=UPI002004DFD0|nr:regulatory protein RecX [Micrococcus sp. JXJ CY 30]